MIWLKSIGPRCYKPLCCFACFFLAFLLIMYATPSACLALEPLSHSTYADIAGTAADADFAFDDNPSSYAEISTSIDAYTSIIYLWELPPERWSPHMGRNFMLEVIDPKGDEPVPVGEDGELVYTPLNRKAMSLIRYRSAGEQAILAIHSGFSERGILSFSAEGGGRPD